jgi:hypothetical protein
LKKNGCGTVASMAIGVRLEKRAIPTPTAKLRASVTPPETSNAGPAPTV